MQESPASHLLFARLIRRLHEDNRGAVSLETVLLLGAIALPVLIFVIRIGWPMVKGMFQHGMDELDSELHSVN